MSVQHFDTASQPDERDGFDDIVRQHVREARAAYDVDNFDRAIAACERLLALRPNNAEALLLLGMTSWKLDEPLHAIDMFRRAQQSDQNTREYADALATILAHLGESNESLYFAKLATILEPHPFGDELMPERFREFFKNLSFARPHIYRTRALDALERGAFREADTLLEKQLGLTPKDPETLRLEAETAYENGQLAKAVKAIEAVIESCATAPDHDRLARILAQAGYFDAALESHDAAITLRPDDPSLAQSRLRTLAMRSGDGSRDPEYDAACHDWFARFAPLPSARSVRIKFGNPADPKRRLRIGYLGSNLHSRGLAPILEPILARHDPTAYEALVYASGAQHDMTTQSLMRRCSRWTDVTGVDPETIAQILQNDKIDIAVDLTGHGPNSLMHAMMHNPAPVRLGWLGTRPATPDAYDHHLLGTDALSLPVEHPVSTSLLPDLTPASPCSSNGYVTFGLVAPVAAINRATFALAQKVLSAITDARLLIANAARHDTGTMSRIHTLAEEFEISDRVIVAELENPKSNRAEFFDHIDILLDTAPTGRFMESAEALWMGTPVLTLVSHRAECVLATSGHSDWVFKDAAALVHGASELANSFDNLNAIRRDLRAEIARSPLYNWSAFVTKLEAAYRAHWAVWCDTENTPENP